MTKAPIRKTVGFKDMHPDQVDTLLKFIDMALQVSAEECFEDLFDAAEDVVVLFGGVGINIGYETDA